MSVPTVISRGRFVLSRGLPIQRATGSTLRHVSTRISQRQFTSSIRIQQEIVETPATGPEVPLTATRSASSGRHAQSIAITKIHPQTVKSELERLFRGAGLDVSRMQLRVDRFTFRTDRVSFIELASEEQAKKAIQVLNGQQLHGKALVVRPVGDTFYWDQGFKKENRMFYHDENTPTQAIQGLLQGRRYMIQVENPGWPTENDSGKSFNVARREIIDKHFGPFGVEAVGALNPVWRQSRKSDRSFLTYIEFASKEGAEQAAEALNDKVIEGKRIWLTPCTLNPTMAKQVAKVDKSVLAQLQQNGFLPTKTTSDKVAA